MKNLISWVSIPSTDYDRAVAFYSAIFDTKMETMGEGDERMAPFFPLDHEWVNGGVSADSSFKPTSDGVRIYLDVAGQLDEVLSRIEAAGGSVVTGRTSMGEHGFWGLIKDTEWNNIGLHSIS